MRYFKSKAAQYTTETILTNATTAVRAAAQIGDIGSLTNIDRKRKAVEILTSLLGNIGIILSEYDTSNIIEGVYREERYYLIKER